MEILKKIRHTVCASCRNSTKTLYVEFCVQFIYNLMISFLYGSYGFKEFARILEDLEGSYMTFN